MITIRDYALRSGVSHQAVYKMISTHEDELRSHIIKKGRTRFLTVEAVNILDGYRQQSPVVADREEDILRIKQLEQERERLLIETADLGSRLAKLAEWRSEKAVELAKAEQQKFLLTTTQEDLEKTKRDLQEANDLLDQRQAAMDDLEKKMQEDLNKTQRDLQEANGLLDQRENAIKDLEKKLEEERSRRLTWRERFTGRRK